MTQLPRMQVEAWVGLAHNYSNQADAGMLPLRRS